MKKHKSTALILLAILAIVIGAPGLASAQVTEADYARATGLRAKYQPLALNIVDRGGWIGKTSRYWYRKSVAGGAEFWIADAAAKKKSLAFDHARLAAALAAASGEKFEALTLPFAVLTFSEDGKSVEFGAAGGRWSCDLATYALKKLDTPAPRDPSGYPLSMWERGPAPQAASKEWKASPDGKWEAAIRNYNLVLRAKGQKPESVLSRDGTEGDYYTFDSIAWSPDSKKIAACRLRRGYHRVIQYVESSPADQLQPKYHAMEYAKPGDVLDVERPVLFHVDTKARIEVDPALFPNPYEISALVWRADSRAFTFEYNERGHQTYRVVEVDGTTGAARAVVDERAKTFFTYSEWGGKKFRRDLADGREVVWMSERSGWNHLYLLDGATGAVKNPITTGEWVVRSVDRVDEAKRQVWFQACGVVPNQDPYFVDAYRANLDGSGLVRLTEPGANHVVSYSADGAHFVDTRSRVDLAPVTEIRSAADGKTVMTVEKGDLSALVAAGWKAPEVFVAKGRDGLTDIWGVVYRPSNYDPARKYPVIEYIYAGPHDSYVPKSFRAFSVPAGPGRARLHRQPVRRHGHEQPLQGLPRRLLQEPGRRRIPRPHPLAPGPRGQGPVLRHHPRRHLRQLRRRPERARRAPLPPRVLQGRRLLLRLSRQPHGQDLVERAVDGLAARPRIRGLLQRRQRRASSRASSCSSSARWTPTSTRPRPCRSSTP